jgi:hypothetical protein
LIVAISAVSESGDHYLWCETGTAQEIVKTMKSLEDFYYLGNIMVEPLQSGEHESADDLKNKINAAIYSHWNNV